MDAAVALAEHLPMRPSWTCSSCHQPWPCVLARVNLRDEFRHFPTTLHVYLSAQYELAAEDFAGRLNLEARDELRARMVLWARRNR